MVYIAFAPSWGGGFLFYLFTAKKSLQPFQQKQFSIALPCCSNVCYGHGQNMKEAGSENGGKD